MGKQETKVAKIYVKKGTPVYVVDEGKGGNRVRNVLSCCGREIDPETLRKEYREITTSSKGIALRD